MGNADGGQFRAAAPVSRAGGTSSQPLDTRI